MASKTTPPRPRLPLFKSGKPGLAESDCEETLALLKILALGNREVEAGKVKRVVDVVRRMRAKKTGT